MVLNIFYFSRILIHSHQWTTRAYILIRISAHFIVQSASLGVFLKEVTLTARYIRSPLVIHWKEHIYHGLGVVP